MKRVFCFIISLILGLCFFSALAETQPQINISITYSEDAVLSEDTAVPATVLIEQEKENTTQEASIRLYGQEADWIGTKLPQENLLIDGDDSDFILYNGGNDGLFTKGINRICYDLIAQSGLSIPVREQKAVSVTLNGEYWGLYTMEETIQEATARFEGLTDVAKLNVANHQQKTIFGDATGLSNAFAASKLLDLSVETDRTQLETLFDTDSFLNWMTINTYFGNSNLFSDIAFYQVDDGPWKSAPTHFSWAFYQASDDSVTLLLDRDTKQPTYGDAALLASRMLREPVYREAFLTKLGALYQALPTPVMQAAADKAVAEIAPAMEAHTQRWSAAFAQMEDGIDEYPADSKEALLFWQYRVYRLCDKTMVRRPWFVYDSAQRAFNLSDSEMAVYFGSEKTDLPEVPDDTWADYKTANK